MGKPVRKTRFDAIHTLFNMNKAGMIELDIAKKQMDYAGHFLYESEIEKFLGNFPDVESDEFKAFVNECDVISAKKRSGGGGRGSSLGKRGLATPEKAVLNGVAEEDVEAYCKLVNSVYDHIVEINKLVTTVHVSFSFPKDKVKEEKPIAEVTDATTDNAPPVEETPQTDDMAAPEAPASPTAEDLM